MEETSRRTVLAGITMGLVASLAGCSTFDDGDQNNDDFEEPEQEQERVCTEAYITDFNWDGTLFSEDSFTATLVNEGDVAGTVVISLEFWESEAKETRLGTVERSAAIGAQATKEITIEANPPSDNAEWASMSVTEQDCQQQ